MAICRIGGRPMVKIGDHVMLNDVGRAQRYRFGYKIPDVFVISSISLPYFPRCLVWRGGEHVGCMEDWVTLAEGPW